MNDLCQLKLGNVRIITFADGTSLLFLGDTWEEVYQHAQKEFTLVLKWIRQQGVTLNIEKTKYNRLKTNHLNYCHNDIHNIIVHSCIFNSPCTCPTLQRAGDVKYLSVVIDKHLTFNKHIDLLSNRIRKLVYIFKNLQHVADESVIKMTYLALCQSILSYCISGKTHMLNLERVQRFVLF